jgi:hypothetical protein
MDLLRLLLRVLFGRTHMLVKLRDLGLGLVKLVADNVDALNTILLLFFEAPVFKQDLVAHQPHALQFVARNFHFLF